MAPSLRELSQRLAAVTEGVKGRRRRITPLASPTGRGAPVRSLGRIGNCSLEILGRDGSMCLLFHFVDK